MRHLFAVGLCLLLGTQASAGLFTFWKPCLEPLGMKYCPCTPADFCAKPLPCAAPNIGYRCDDYCRKPEPCVVSTCVCIPEDYCAKPLPRLCTRACDYP